jgi:transcriptional regulator with XRE-family HTH domain
MGDPAPSLSETLERVEALVRERNLRRSDVLDVRGLAARTALPESTVSTLLTGGTPPADTVNDRVRARISTLAQADLTRTAHRRMSDLAGDVSRRLGVSEYWARQICEGKKVPSVELLHGLVEFFGVEGGEAFFTAPAAEALNRALLPVLAALRPAPERPSTPVGPPPAPPSEADPSAVARSEYDDVRGIALRQARDLPQERWNVLSATLKALLELDLELDENEEAP